VAGAGEHRGGVADVRSELPFHHHPAPLRRVGGVDDRRVDVPPLVGGEGGAHVFRWDDFRRHHRPEPGALEVAARVDAGRHRGGVGQRYPACSAEIAEDLEAVSEDVVALGGLDEIHGRLVGGEEDIGRRAGSNLPRQGVRTAKIVNNLVVSLRLVERG